MTDNSMGPKICTKVNLGHSALAYFYKVGMPSNEGLMVFPGRLCPNK